MKLPGPTPLRSSVSGRATLQKPFGGAQCLADVVEGVEDAAGVVTGGVERTGRGGGTLFLKELGDGGVPWVSSGSPSVGPSFGLASTSSPSCTRSPFTPAGGLWISNLTSTSTSSSSSLVLEVFAAPDRQDDAPTDARHFPPAQCLTFGPSGAL